MIPVYDVRMGMRQVGGLPGENEIGQIGADLDFDPRDLGRLAFWVGGPIPGLVHGDPIAARPDRSGWGNHAQQATASKRPTARQGVLNGGWVDRYDGADDEIGLSGAGLNVLKCAPGVTSFLVYSATAPGVERFPFFADVGTGGGATRYGVAQEKTAGQFLIRARRLDADSVAVMEGGAFPVSTMMVRSDSINFSTTTATTWKNGTQAATNASFSTAGSFSNTPSTVVIIGSASGTQFISGDVGQVILYSRTLLQHERRRMERRLGRLSAIPVAA
jgi:hypothetical protein